MNRYPNESSKKLNHPPKRLTYFKLSLFTACLIVCNQQQLFAFAEKNHANNLPKITYSIYGSTRKPINAEKVITGKVLDEKDNPIEGAGVSEKGTKNATKTNSKGEYTLKTKSAKPVLVFTSIGFNTKEITVGDAKEINVQLKSSVTILEDVVVIGYGTVKKKDLTGAVGKVNVEDLQKAPVKSFDEALAGRIAGVSVVASDGQPGGAINIVIRGNSSLTQSNSPLYVVDGFPIETSLNNLINPADIESIEVLKDASATAIYGARGANGVIIITTKKGKDGPPTLRYETYYGIQEITKRMKLMDPYEFVKLQNDISPSQTTNNYLTNGKTIEDYKNDKGIDWQNKMFRQASMQNHTLSLSGGSQQTKYLISGNYLNQDGVIINTGFKRYQLRFLIDQTINKTTKIGLNVNGGTSKAYGVVTNTNTTSGSYSPSLNLLYSILGGRPTTNGVDIVDSLLDPINTNVFDYRVNPYIEATNQLRENITNNILINISLDKTIIPGLVLKITGGINYSVLQNNVFNNSKTQNGNIQIATGTNGVNGSITFGRNYSWTNENILTYTKSFTPKHKLIALIGNSQQGTRASSDGHRSIMLPNESLGLSGLDEGTPIQVTATSGEWVLRSYLMRVNYDYGGKFLLTVSNRWDGSSKFGEGNKWKSFPSGAIAWRFSKEKFMKNLTIVNDAKLRIGYGKVGNNRVNDYSWASPITFSQTAAGGYPYNNIPTAGAYVSTYANKNLQWETIESFNLGLDVALLKDKITLTIDGYTKKTNDLLYNSSISYVNGHDNMLQNIGSVKNSGIEISINTVNVKNKNFTWTTGFNIAYNRSKVLALGQGQPSILSNISWDNTFNTPLYFARVNQPIAQLFGFIWDGIYQYEDFDFNPANKTYVLTHIAAK